MEHEMMSECKERFERIDAHLEKGDNEFKDHSGRIVKVETNVDNLMQSLKGVTNALWGVAASIMATLFGFLIWFIQTK